MAGKSARSAGSFLVAGVAHRFRSLHGSKPRALLKSAESALHRILACDYEDCKSAPALRANLVKRAERWRWSSLWRRQQEDASLRAPRVAWPVPEPADWLRRVNAAQTEAELVALRRSVLRGTPYGAEGWTARTARRLGLEYTLRERGRPKKGA